MNQIADNTLMLEVKSGDLDKLALLFERYHKVLFGFFYRMCADKEIAEDLVQNVFYRMLKYKHTFMGEGKFTTWMYHLARNVFADHHHKNKHFVKKEDLIRWQENIADNISEEQLQKEEEIRLLQAAMQQLSADKRELLILSRYQGLKYKQIGEILHCSEGNVKVKVFRAMEELKRIYSTMNC